MRDVTPVVAVALDAAEITLIERLCDEGRMPTLHRLRQEARWGRVRSGASDFMSCIWPTFYTSSRAGHHGWTYGKVWRPERMRLEYGAASWLPQSCFWERLGPDVRAAILDMPFAVETPRTLNGFFVSGWHTHDQLGAFSHPARSWRGLRRRFGPPAMKAERFGVPTPATLLEIRHGALAGLEQTGAMARWLLESASWNLFMVVVGSLHRGTHYLWDLSQIDADALDADTRATLEGARDELYAAADHALGSILDAAPRDARIMVFALHGMQRNGGWSDRFADMVRVVQEGGESHPPGEGLLYRVRRRIPWRLASQLTRRVPFRVNQALLPLWSSGMHDWRETRFFALPCDVDGYLRINLRGREAQGIVEPGPEHEALLDELEAAFRSFRTIDTGEPVVRAVVRTDDTPAAHGPRRHLLPDLVVRWHRTRSQDFSGVTSERYGALRWEKGSPLPSGRSGNHQPTGWVAASGPGIEPGPELDCDSIDLVPTLFRWIGADDVASFHGQAIPELAP